MGSPLDQASLTADTQCLLLKLPPELRNIIYGMAFATHEFDREYDPIALEDARPPLPGLLLSCKQVHQEAAQMYRQMLKDFWSRRMFVLDFTKPPYKGPGLPHLPHPTNVALDHLRILYAIVPRGDTLVDMPLTRSLSHRWTLSMPASDSEEEENSEDTDRRLELARDSVRAILQWLCRCEAKQALKLSGVDVELLIPLANRERFLHSLTMCRRLCQHQTHP